MSGADVWWGLRGYNASYAAPGTNPAIDIVKTSDGTSQGTINILSDGTLDVATITALGFGVSISKWYDQTGGGRHLLQATLANMPLVVLNFLGVRPTANFPGGHTVSSSLNYTNTQPFNSSWVGQNDSGPGSLENGTQNALLGWANTDIAEVNMGSAGMQVASTHGVLRAFNATANSTNSFLNIDGTDNGPGNAGTNVFDGTNIVMGLRAGSAATFHICEWGIWPGPAWTQTQRGNIQANQKPYWGTP
jgi:hypothetical protein